MRTNQTDTAKLISALDDAGEYSSAGRQIYGRIARHGPIAHHDLCRIFRGMDSMRVGLACQRLEALGLIFMACSADTATTYTIRPLSR